MDISCQVDFFFKLWLFWGWKTNSDDNQANYWVSVQWRSKRHGIACTGKDMTKDAHGRGLSVVWQQYRARPRLFLLPSSSSFPEILLHLISFPSPHYSLFNLIWPPPPPPLPLIIPGRWAALDSRESHSCQSQVHLDSRNRPEWGKDLSEKNLGKPFMFHILSRQTTFGRDLMNGDLLEMARPAVRSSHRSRWGSTPERSELNRHLGDDHVLFMVTCNTWGYNHWWF